jgi:hypothetical protein
MENTENTETTSLTPSTKICSICQEELISNSKTYKLECNHEFHTECIMTWFRSSNQNHSKCPTCRDDTQVQLDPVDAKTRFEKLLQYAKQTLHPSTLKKDIRNYQNLKKAVQKRKQQRIQDRRQIKKLRETPPIKQYLKLVRESHPKKDLEDLLKLEDREYLIGCTHYPDCPIQPYHRSNSSDSSNSDSSSNAIQQISLGLLLRSFPGFLPTSPSSSP